MKLFMYGILELIKKGESESITSVEEKIKSGIATALYYKHPNVFDSVAFHTDHLITIDEYYSKNYSGVADGLEKTYACDEKDGLYLIIKLILEKL